MTIYRTIANDEDNIKLMIGENERGLYMPSIEFKINGLDEFWDNPSYIFGIFHKSIKKYVAGTMKKKHVKCLKPLTFLNKEYAEEILEMLEKGVELGWHKVD